VGSEPFTAPQIAVPFLDLKPSHADLKLALMEEIASLIDDGAFTNGPQVAAFEDAFASYCGTDSCVGLASGLDALRLALLAAGIEPGDEVIVPAMTFIATLEAVSQVGARPVLVDVDESDYCLDGDAVTAAIGPKTRFVLPVHLYGQMADMRTLERAAADHGLLLLEDACQAHGASRDGLRAGATGFAAAFSFYPSKNLGAFGDAGALVTDDAALAAKVKALREHGQVRKYVHDFEGYTARLDTIQALVLLHKLPLLDAWNGQRRAAAARLSAELEGIGDLRLPPVPPGSEPVWHVYVVRTDDPGALVDHLAERGIRAGRHYPEAVHLSPAYAWLEYRQGAFPVAEALANECVSLPIFPGISEEQIDAVAEALSDYFRGG
jgi:dTDP-4-amino-4,6-dideoxygalactose transaminase